MTYGEDVGGEESGEEPFDLAALEEDGGYGRTTRRVTTVVEVDAHAGFPEVLKKLVSGVAQSIVVVSSAGEVANKYPMTSWDPQARWTAVAGRNEPTVINRGNERP